MLNTAQFSAAKDLSETLALQRLAVSSDGFNDFKEKAYKEVTSINRDQWLRVEMDVCNRNAVMGEGWRKMEESKDLYPYWAYKTEQDDRVREEHAALDGLVFQIGDPEGDAVCPVCDWNCRCSTEPVDDQYLKENDKQVSKGSDYLTENDPETGKPYINEDFRFNPGITGPMPNDSSYSEVLSSANKVHAEMFDLPISNSTEELLTDPIDMSKINNYEKYGLDEDVTKSRKGMPLFNRISNKDFVSLAGDTPDSDLIINKIDIGKMSENDIRIAITTDKYESLVTMSQYGKDISYDINHVDVFKEFEGHGLGAKMFANMLDASEKSGFENIELRAAKGLHDGKEYNGYYTWARFGFELRNPQQQEYFLKLVKTQGTNETVRGAKTLQELMRTNEGQKFWKEKGFDYLGRFNIKKDKNYFLNYFNHRFDSKVIVKAIEKPDFIFKPAKTLEIVTERLKNAGILHVDISDLSIDSANAILETIEKEALTSKISLSKIETIFEDSYIKASYDFVENKISINLKNIEKFSNSGIINYPERLKGYEQQFSELKKRIDKLKPAKGARFDIIDKYNSLKERILDIKKRIKNNENAIQWSVSSSAKTKEESIKISTQHELGHLRQYKSIGIKEKYIFNRDLSISEYGRTDREEYFAEWYAHFKTFGENGVPEDLLKLFKSF